MAKDEAVHDGKHDDENDSDDDDLDEEDIFHMQQEFLRQEVRPETWRAIQGEQSQHMEDFLTRERRKREERAARMLGMGSAVARPIRLASSYGFSDGVSMEPTRTSPKPLCLPSKRKAKRKAADRADNSGHQGPRPRPQSALPSMPSGAVPPWFKSRSIGSSPAPFDEGMHDALEALEAKVSDLEAAKMSSRKCPRTSSELSRSMPPQQTPGERRTGSRISTLTQSMPPAFHSGIDISEAPARGLWQTSARAAHASVLSHSMPPQLPGENRRALNSRRMAPSSLTRSLPPTFNYDVDSGVGFDQGSSLDAPTGIAFAEGQTGRTWRRPARATSALSHSLPPHLGENRRAASRGTVSSLARSLPPTFNAGIGNGFQESFSPFNQGMDDEVHGQFPSTDGTASAVLRAAERASAATAARPWQTRTLGHDAQGAPRAWASSNATASDRSKAAATSSPPGPARRRSNDLLLLKLLNDTVVSPVSEAKPSVPAVSAPFGAEDAYSPVGDALMSIEDAVMAATLEISSPPLARVEDERPGQRGSGMALAEGVQDASWSPTNTQDASESISPMSQVDGGASPPEGMADYILGTLGCDGAGSGATAVAMPPPPPLARMDSIDSKNTIKASNVSPGRVEKEFVDTPSLDGTSQPSPKAGKRTKGRSKGDEDDTPNDVGTPTPNHIVTPSSAAISALSAEVRDRTSGADSEVGRGEAFSIPQYASAMEATQASQEAIHDWDREFGLRRAHSKTMRESCRSRKEVLEFLKGEGGNLLLPGTSPSGSASADIRAGQRCASTEDSGDGQELDKLQEKSEGGGWQVALSPSMPSQAHVEEHQSNAAKHRASASARRHEDDGIDDKGAEELTRMLRRASLTIPVPPLKEEGKVPDCAPGAIPMAPPRDKDRKQFHASSA